MRRLSGPLLIVGCVATLTFACYERAIFRGEQFAYRDSAHYYYPLHQRVQAEWDAGRWPLWEPEENSGMPLMGNPTAAVLYPGKLIFAALPYPLGARVYVIVHSLLAFGAMLALLRGWEISWTGATLGALGYAFGGPILFQYCNIIYLVGAAWVPLGFRAVDRWVRLGRRLALLELAIVLAMETLGGDPESAYLTGLCAAGYAATLAWLSRRPVVLAGDPGQRQGGNLAARIGAVGAFLAIVWVAGTLAMAYWAPIVRPVSLPRQPSLPFVWMPWVPLTVAAAWGLGGLVLLARWRRLRAAGGGPVLVPMLAGLAVAAGLAGALSAAQLLPVLEFTRQSGRAVGAGPHDIFPFSLHPLRLVEFLWPNLFGTPFHGNRLWLGVLPAATSPKVWVPTLYIGVLSLVLALGTLRLRGVAPWRGWMTAIAAVSLLGSFGECGGPLWVVRQHPKAAALIGPQDPSDVASIRSDRYLRDGDGSPYWLLATALPGFRQFRFPSKLLTFTVLALTALAGQGWDCLVLGEARARRRTAAWSLVLLAITLVAFGWTVARRSAILAWFGTRNLASGFGPFDAPGALAETQRGLVQAALVLGVALAIALRIDRNVRVVPALALVVMTADLVAANARYVMTLPQHLMDSTPAVLSVIERAEKEHPSPDPFRVHRVPLWNPNAWITETTHDRARDFVVWERDTLQPKYGLRYGLQYTMTLGVAELYDYSFYFGGFLRTVRGEVARKLSVAPGTEIVAYPRRAFDMWNSRYFILPYVPRWEEEHRGIASFLDRTERIDPPVDAFRGPGGKDREYDWAYHHDYQVVRNLDAYPRAWVVHEARSLRPIHGLNREERNLPIQEIVFSNDAIWNDPARTVYDPRRYVWVEESERHQIVPYLPGGLPGREETVKVVRYESDRVELDAVLERPGVVVLSDVYYPGWSLMIDGHPAPIYRANRLMRGATVPSGQHRLVYTYWPASFRVGLGVSCAGLVVLVLLGVWFRFQPLSTSFNT